MTSEIDMERAYTTRTIARDAVGKPPSQYKISTVISFVSIPADTKGRASLIKKENVLFSRFLPTRDFAWINISSDLNMHEIISKPHFRILASKSVNGIKFCGPPPG